jgi:signal transduction histidine kinase
MNIRSKLIILFVSIVAVISIGTSAAIYFFSSDYRQDDFYRRMENKGRITARLLIEVDEVNEDVLKRIEKDNPINLANEKIVIYDFKDSILYTSDDERELQIPKDLLDQVRLDEQVRFTQKNYEGIGFLYTGPYDRFVVIVAATDIYGLNKLKNLRTILLIVFGASIIIFFISATFYVGNVLKPISKVVQEVDDISATSLHRRVDEGNGTDEISRLAQTFNSMLARLETAFTTQKQFIANASHEIRNPLTALLGQIDVCLMAARTSGEYENVLRSLREDITNLKTVSNRLLLLAQASLESEKQFSLHRCDQILWEAKSDLSKMNPDYNVLIELAPEIDDERSLSVMGDEQLLKGAFINIMDNACKYSSNHSVNVHLSHTSEHIVIKFQDEGIGISLADKTHIFEPFYRGNNVNTTKGNGIGLSLVYRIIKSHSGHISIDSTIGKGTLVTVSLPLPYKLDQDHSPSPLSRQKLVADS